ncbi:MAG: 4-hydroxybenzoate polyprenyltransferase [Pseudohongiellaceae bacterium]|jgi:4-hydroxybenzoate polyprenyltransferase
MDLLQKLLSKPDLWVRANFPVFHSKLPALAELTRINKPIGIALLLWPTIAALWIAADGFPDLDLLIIFILGTVVMRSAGCCVNDFADYKIDNKVGRTEARPLATGLLKRQDAFYCFIILSLLGFILVLFTNLETILLSFGAVALVAIYPFMKRFTNLPQVILGITFSWGILMAFTAQAGAIPQTAYLLFLANVLLTVAYDTQYAMVDREFDLKIGVKSSAILFGDADKLIIGCLQVLFILSMWLVGGQLQFGLPYYLSLMVASGFLVYQQFLIRDRLPGPCFKAFLNNNWVGATIFTGTFLSLL